MELNIKITHFTNKIELKIDKKNCLMKLYKYYFSHSLFRFAKKIP